MHLHTKDLDDDFFPKLRAVAADLGADPLQMLRVMKSESDVRAAAWNDNPKSLPPEKRWNASGLIQFMPPTLKGLGWARGHAAFRELSASQQLDFVRAYYLPHKGHLGSVGALYTATFLPALVKHAGDPSFVLTAEAGPLPWAYSPNKAFDTNRDKAITVGELEAAVERACHGPRWEELVARLAASAPGAEQPCPEEPLPFDITSIRGVQQALSRLGHHPGPIDGIAGPQTHAAIVAFQAARELSPDGVVGPLTRAALAFALRTSA